MSDVTCFAGNQRTEESGTEEAHFEGQDEQT